MSNVSLTPSRIRRGARYAAFALLLAVAPLMSGGCPLPNSVTTARFVNNTLATLSLSSFFSSDQLALESVIELFGEEINTQIGPTGSIDIVRDCDELQAIFVEEAELNLVGDIGPETSTRVFRDGSDFNCGDIITFEFTSGTLFTTLDVNVSVR